MNTANTAIVGHAHNSENKICLCLVMNCELDHSDN